VEKSKGPTKDEWHTSYECLAPVDAAPMLLTGAQRARQRAEEAPPITERNFSEQWAQAAARFILIIGGLVDPAVNVARSLTIWSVLVLGVGAVSVVFIRAYMVGLLGVPVLFAGVGVTVTIALGVGLTVTTAAHRAALMVQRVPIPEWLSEG